MSLQALSDYTIVSRYSRYSADKKRRETWPEMIDRVFDMHKGKYAKELENKELLEEFEFAKRMVKKKRVLGSQRALQFGGDAILKHHAKMFNCSFGYIDRPEAFSEAMYLLLCGCGVGFSVQKKHISKLPKILDRNKGEKTFVAEDSIEGWADCVKALMESYFRGNENSGYRIKFDLSAIRPEGALIAGQFKAPGPKALATSIEKIERLIDARLEVAKTLRPIDAYDCIMHFSDAVLSGGVRRSATICLFSKDDPEMMSAKTGDWYITNPQRGRSNNSVLLLKNEVTKEEFAEIMESTRQFGEPGFVFSEDEDIGYNPCVEIGLYPQTEDGRSGFHFCVAGDTRLITRDGIHNIEDLVGKQVEIWNGERWSEVEPYQTGDNDDLYRVYFSDGSYLDATANHKFLVKHRFESEYREVETVDLIKEISKSKYKLSIPRSNFSDFNFGVTNDLAYEYGFFLGDGHMDHGMPKAHIYAGDKNLPLKGTLTDRSFLNANGTEYKTLKFDKCDAGICQSLKNGDGLLEEVSKWDRNSILQFLAGWIDADGSQASKGIRLYGKYENLSIAQLLLSKVGFDSSLNLAQKKGVRTNLCVRKNDLYYLQITKTYGIPTNRVICDNKDTAKYKGKDQIINKIERISSGNKSYCLTENERHQCVFNNVLTKQCNLTEINGKFCDTEENFYECCRASAIVGTMQAGYTDFKYLSKESKEITDREALLGCSITGFMDNPDILLDPEIQKKGAKIVKETNKKIAKLLGLNAAARTTCVKPAGSTSCILSSSSGIHPHHAKRYIRRVQANRNEFPVQYFKKSNPLAVEKSVWSTNGTDEVISFLCEVPKGAITKNNLKATELLEKVQLTQQNWVEHGTNTENCMKPYIRHNVSNTITVKEDEWDDVRDFIFKNRKWFAGISLLSASGDLDYPQAPFTSVLDSAEIIKEYGDGALLASGLIVDGLSAFDNNLWAACDCINGYGEVLSSTDEPEEPKKPRQKRFKTEANFASALANYAIELNLFYQEKGKYKQNELKLDWVRRANQFALRYFEGDIRKMCHCLKHAYTYKQWLDLKREYKEVNWADAIEDTETYVSADTLGAQACAGGKCEI